MAAASWPRKWYRSPADKVEFDSDLFDTTRLPRSALAGIIFHPPTDRRRDEKLAGQIVFDTGESDRVLLTNGDEFSGTVGGFSKGSLEFQTAAGPLKIEAARVDAVIFNPRRRAISKPRGMQVWVGFRDGSRVLASSIVSAGQKAKLSASREEPNCQRRGTPWLRWRPWVVKSCIFPI